MTDSADRTAPAGGPTPRVGSTDRLDVWFAALVGGLAALSWVGLTLAEVGLYHRTALILLGIPGAIVAAWWSARGLGRDSRDGAVDDGPSRAGAAWLLLWVALAASLVSPPGEHVIEGEDGSVYLAIGRALQREAALTFPEPVVDNIALSEWPAVFDTTTAWPRLLELFPGGVQLQRDANVVRPGFFHLFPLWIANVEALGGPRAGYWVAPGFAVLAIVAVWLLGRELDSVLAANLAAGLLCLNFAQVWFARTPSSEILSQFLILSGLYFTTSLQRRPCAARGALAGAAFGLAACARIDMLVLVAPVVAAYLVLTAERRSSAAWRAFAVVFAVLVGQSVAHGLLISGPYTQRILWYLFASRWGTWDEVVLAPAVMVLTMLALAVYRRCRTDGTSRATWVLLALVGLGSAALLWQGLWSGPLTALLTPVGVALAIAGAIRLGLRAGAADLLALAILLASALVYLDSVREFSPMPTLLRRFVPVILPLSLLGVALAAAWMFSGAGRYRWLTLMVPAVVAGHFAQATLPLVAAAPMRGVHDRVATIAADLPDDAVVLVDTSTPSHLGLGLRYTFRRDVLFVQPEMSSADVLRRFADSLLRSERGVVALLAADSDDPHAVRGQAFDGLDLNPTRSWSLDYVTIKPDRREVPTSFHHHHRRLQLYEVSPAAAVRLPIQVEIGQHDAAARRIGFHAAEQMGPASARWTAERAEIALPKVMGRAALLVLRLAAPRPAALPAPVVEVTIGQRVVGTTPPLGPEFRSVAFPLDAEMAAALSSGRTLVSLRAPTFVPRTYGLGTDGRTLGVALDWVRLEP